MAAPIQTGAYCECCGRGHVTALTPHQRRVWEQVRDVVRSGESPTYQRIASRLRLTPPTVHEHVEALKAFGLVTRWDRGQVEIVDDV